MKKIRAQLIWFTFFGLYGASLYFGNDKLFSATLVLHWILLLVGLLMTCTLFSIVSDSEKAPDAARRKERCDTVLKLDDELRRPQWMQAASTIQDAGLLLLIGYQGAYVTAAFYGFCVWLAIMCIRVAIPVRADLIRQARAAESGS